MAINVQFQLDGLNKLVPANFDEVEETFIYGQVSNQPVISTTNFTLYGDGAVYIRDHINKGYVLRPISVSLIYSVLDQNGVTEIVDVMEDYVIDLTKGFEFIEPDSMAGSDLGCNVSIRKSDEVDNMLIELEGLTWGLLKSEGKVKSSNYQPVKTAIQPVIDTNEAALMVLTALTVRLTIIQVTKDIQELINDVQNKIASGNLDPVEKAANILWVTLAVVSQLAIAALIILATVESVITILSCALPPIVKNKFMTWREGLTIICNRLGYDLVADFPFMDYEGLLPSSGIQDGSNIIRNIARTFIPNENGYPSPNDFGYIARDYVEVFRLRTNSRIDIIDKTVYIRNEDDPAFYKKSSFKEPINVLYPTGFPNIAEIPQTRLIRYDVDYNDEYTTSEPKGSKFEVKNISNKIPFKGLEEIALNVCRGSVKKNLTPLEKFIYTIAKTADELITLLGGKPQIAKQFKNDRTNVLRVSSSNYSKPKLIQAKGGNIVSDYREKTSARQIESDYYVNRSIVRGTGQKWIYPNYQIPFTVKDRDQLVFNGSFVSVFGDSRFRTINPNYETDTADVTTEVNNNYIASSDFEEVLIDPDE